MVGDFLGIVFSVERRVPSKFGCFTKEAKCGNCGDENCKRHYFMRWLRSRKVIFKFPDPVVITESECAAPCGKVKAVGKIEVIF